jgi:hypothetical protein
MGNDCRHAVDLIDGGIIITFLVVGIPTGK